MVEFQAVMRQFGLGQELTMYNSWSTGEHQPSNARRGSQKGNGNSNNSSGNNKKQKKYQHLQAQSII